MLPKVVSSVLLFFSLALEVSSSVAGVDLFEKSKPSPTPFQDWDYLVFSQRWPVTTCEQWKEEQANNTCQLPNSPVFWTVHGIWPTKTGKNGPFFCNSAVHFDPTFLEPIMDDMEKYWVNVEANTKKNSFWKHEWDKHGTCAASSADFNTVEKYFKRGLDWNRQYDIGLILSKSNVTPGLTGYTIGQIYSSILTVLNKKPAVECVTDGSSKQSLMNEIRLCFDKELQLIDCVGGDGLFGDDVITNCNLKKPVMYFEKLPPPATPEPSWEMDFEQGWMPTPRTNDAGIDYASKLARLHRILQFLIWFTL